MGEQAVAANVCKKTGSASAGPFHFVERRPNGSHGLARRSNGRDNGRSHQTVPTMHPPETFDTARCLLRRPRPADAEAMFAAFGQDAEVNRYLGWKTHASVADTRRQITYDTHRWDRGAAWTWLVELRADARIVGFVQLQPRGHQAHLGFLLARSHWGRGLMAEAATPVVRHVLGMPQIYRVDAVCDVDNPASARVLEKIGMNLEGRLRRYIEHPALSDEPRDVLMYSMVR